MEPATAPRRRRRRWEIGNDRRHHTVRSIVGVAGNGFDAAGWQANGLEAKRSVEVSWGEGDFWERVIFGAQQRGNQFRHTGLKLSSGTHREAGHSFETERG